MERAINTASRPHTPECGSRTLAARTYSQIAALLTAREGVPSNPASVKQTCQAAERKLVRALRNDPLLREWIGPESLAPLFHETGQHPLAHEYSQKCLCHDGDRALEASGALAMAIGNEDSNGSSP